MVTDADLVAAAREMLCRAYAPYSGFSVGAALLAADGRIFTGCNIENASFSVSVCAERSALCAAVSAGAREFLSLAVISSSEDICYPCGVCRQAILEFSPSLRVICSGGDGIFESYRLSELLPHSFSDFRGGELSPKAES